MPEMLALQIPDHSQIIGAAITTVGIVTGSK
jgi:hypothetical protein